MANTNFKRFKQLVSAMAVKGHLEYTVGGSGIYVTQTKYRPPSSSVGTNDKIATVPAQAANPKAVVFQKMVTSAEALDHRERKAKEKGTFIDLTQESDSDSGDGDDEAAAGPAAPAILSKKRKRPNAELKISAR